MQIPLTQLKKEWQKDINTIINSSLDAVNPYSCVSEKIDFRNNNLIIDHDVITLKKKGKIF